ncbi:MAG: hypothetical protein V4475_01470 [Pseudomonadota bacterium]
MLRRGDGIAAVPVAHERGDCRLFWAAPAASIRGEAPNPEPASEAIAVTEVLEAGLLSAAAGRVVAL